MLIVVAIGMLQNKLSQIISRLSNSRMVSERNSTMDIGDTTKSNALKHIFDKNALSDTKTRSFTPNFQS